MNTRFFLLSALASLVSLAIGCGPKYPKCDTDTDCHAGEYCVDGQCQECREDAHCDPGETCNAGRCDAIPGYCATQGDCGVDERCERNRCVTAGDDVSSGEESAETACSLSPVLFEFDAAELDRGARDTSQKNARCIAERSIGAVQLTGHTDPRGTEEYNLALSDRRARSVKQYMVSLGVAEDSIRSTGMGEEMASGEDEEGYRRDRRVDVVER